MDQETIKAIADQIADQTIITSWKTWGLQFALWIVGTVLAAFAGAYFAKRGEQKAIAADFESLREQLVRNTEAITEISYKDWKSRELDQIQRQKLESLYQNLAQAPNDLRNIFESAVRGETLFMDSNKSLQSLEMIISLYFPALFDLSQNAITSYFKCVQFTASQSAKIRVLESHLAADQTLLFMSNWTIEYDKFLSDVRILKQEVRKLMHSMRLTYPSKDL